MLAVAFSLALQAAPEWRPVEHSERLTAELAPRLEAREQPGQVLRADGARILRGSAGEEDGELPCTSPEGTGAIHELCAEPGGLVFVASERGLFVSHVLAEASDPVEFEGAELEPYRDMAVRSIAADVDRDGRRRLWAVVDDALLVVDPSFFWGIAWTAEALPPGRLERVRVANGVLALQTDAGLFQTPLHAHARPAAPVLEVAAQAWGYGDEVSIGVDDPDRRLRHRLDNHHVWVRSADEIADGRLVLAPPRPGHHELDLVAIDDYLVRSPIARAAFDVEYPSSLPSGLGALVMLAVPLACAALLWLAARRYLWGSARSLPRFALSTGALVIVGLQVLAGLFPHAKGWPFVGFSMYTGVSREGDIVYRESMGGIAPAGWSFDMPPFAPGGAIDDPRQVLRPLIEEGAPAALRWARAAVAERPEMQLAGVQARARRTRLLNSGPVEIAPLILSHATFPADWRGGPADRREEQER